MKNTQQSSKIATVSQFANVNKTW